MTSRCYVVNHDKSRLARASKFKLSRCAPPFARSAHFSGNWNIVHAMIPRGCRFKCETISPMHRNMHLAYLVNPAYLHTAACPCHNGQHAHFQVSQDCASLSSSCMSHKSDFQLLLLLFPWVYLLSFLIYKNSLH